MLAATPSSPPASTGAARQQMQEAERARAAQLAARKEAAGRAEAAAAEERRLSEQRVAAAARLREAEAATADAAARMDALARQREEAEQRVQARTEDLAPLLPLIERLSLYPAETMLAVPTSAEDAFRGVLVLQGIAREIEQQVAALRHEQAALDEASRAVQAEAPKLARVEAAQAALALELERQVAAAQANRREAEDDADSAARRAASLAGQADTLRAAIARIEAERRAEEERASAEAARAEQQKRTDAAAEARRRQRAFARPSGQGTLAATGAPRGDLRAPVAGPVIRSWGEATDAGPSTWPILPRSPGGARGLPLRRPRRLRRPLPELRAIVDPGLRRRLSLRPGGTGPA